jgi:hypothetical protein
MKKLFSNVSPEMIKKQYAENAKQLKAMYDKAIATGKKVNGFSAPQLEKLYKQAEKNSK